MLYFTVCVVLIRFPRSYFDSKQIADVTPILGSYTNESKTDEHGCLVSDNSSSSRLQVILHL